MTRKLREYLDEQGRSPFRRWLDRLNGPASARVTTAVKRLEEGNDSNTKSVGEGVYELKIDFGPGYRVYFGWQGQQLIILLAGGSSSTISSRPGNSGQRTNATRKTRGDTMALTRDFRETVQARVARDASYRRALLAEAVNELLAGELQVGKSILRDYVNATIGFEGLAAELGKSSKSLQRMLGSTGNPTAENLLAILKVLQEHEAVHIKVRVTREAA